MRPESLHSAPLLSKSTGSAYFPIGITPTKPLTPTHVKGLLHFDALTRLHRIIEPIGVAHNRRVWDMSLQTARFWTYLDLHHGQLDFDALSESQIGQLYARFSREGTDVPVAALEAMIAKVESEGYVHPSARCVLQSWVRHLQRIGLDTGLLTESHALDISVQGILCKLSTFGDLVDQREFGGGVLWTAWTGHRATRTLISELGLPNYVVALLRQAHDLAQSYNTVHLFYDLSVERDFILLEDFLQALGVQSNRIGFPRMTSNGRALSFRAEDDVVTLGQMICRYENDYGDLCIALGLRLYFLHLSGLRKSFDFSWDGLDEALRMAWVMLSSPTIELGSAVVDREGFDWQSLRKNDGTMNVYKAYALLFEKKVPAETRQALLKVLIA
jgi:hypothetical protein